MDRTRAALLLPARAPRTVLATVMLWLLVAAELGTAIGGSESPSRPTAGTRPEPGILVVRSLPPQFQSIWYQLGSSLGPYGAKYSGPLGTYSAKHRPMAVFAQGTDTTYFVFGGDADGEGRVEVSVGAYSHGTGSITGPVVLLERADSNAHRNPTLEIDEHGHIWVFASAHGDRNGRLFRSTQPYRIEQFEDIGEAEFTYPQPHIVGREIVLLHTRYSRGREIYRATVTEQGLSEPQLVLGFGGHYVVSETHGNRIGVFFNEHPGGNVDARRSLYYLESDDGGRTWQSVGGQPVTTPVRQAPDSAIVLDSPAGERVYLKDIDFTADGRPVALFLTSQDWRPGPQPPPGRILWIAEWNGEEWVRYSVGFPDHNYDTGSLTRLADGRWVLAHPADETDDEAWVTGGQVHVELLESSFKPAQEVEVVTQDGLPFDGPLTYVRDSRGSGPDALFFAAGGSALENRERTLFLLTYRYGEMQ